MPTTKKRIIHTITDWDMDAGEYYLDLEAQVKDWTTRKALYPRLVSHGSKKYYYTNNGRSGGSPYDRYTVTSSLYIPADNINITRFAGVYTRGGLATYEARTPEIAWRNICLPPFPENNTYYDGYYIGYNIGVTYAAGGGSSLVGVSMSPQTDAWGDGYDVWMSRVFLHFSRPANTALFGEITGMKLWLPIYGVAGSTYNYATEEPIGIFLQPSLTLTANGLRDATPGTLLTTIPSFSVEGVGGIKLEIDMPVIEDAEFTLLLDRVDPSVIPPIDTQLIGTTLKAGMRLLLTSSNDCYAYMSYKYDTSAWEAEQY